MPRGIYWNFYKVTLQQNEGFGRRQQLLTKRFQNADTWIRPWGGVEYKYQLYDVDTLTTSRTRRRCVFGRLTRFPKTAHGRRAVDEAARVSAEGSENIDNLADSSEFIYDLETCVLALHRRAPFTSINTTAKALRHLLGVPYPGTRDELDVHVEALRDSEYTQRLLQTDDPLREVRITFARPNPGSGDNILNRIDLGDIAESTHSDELLLDAKKKGGGTLNKEGFLPQSIDTLVEHGYLKKGHVQIGDRRYDLEKAGEKERETVGYYRPEDEHEVDHSINVDRWLEQLAEENDDIYPE